MTFQSGHAPGHGPPASSLPQCRFTKATRGSGFLKEQYPEETAQSQSRRGELAATKAINQETDAYTDEPAAQKLMTPPFTAPAKATNFVLLRFSRMCNNGLFHAEIRNGGFLKDRDFTQVSFFIVQGVSACLVNFVNASVAREFCSCFEGRPSRFAVGEFAVASLLDVCRGQAAGAPRMK
mmetsp:Transcript_15811/g.45073  ORF Transcript_15811/g.45073 Transcript_15811/m.45073 type:complete len:180 (+) Transcript_15811:34-573(+)